MRRRTKRKEEKHLEKEKWENIWRKKYVYCGNEKSEEGKGGRVDGRKIFYVEEKKRRRIRRKISFLLLIR